ncbi:MAG: hypothetical protein IJ759_05700 [Bacteroidales bacterium]|nr:hypothetical protein [Bacteroidales bacterium]
MEQDTCHSLKIQHIPDMSFQKIKSIAKNFCRNLPEYVRDELYEQLERGCDLITTEPQLQQYIYSFGNMHEAKLNLAFDNVPKEIFDYKDIAVIDYGCGQAMATMVLADYFKENNYNIENIKSINLIEPSFRVLERAELYAYCLYPQTTKIKTINKFMDDLTKEDLYQEHSLVIHLFSNILDVESFSLEQLADTIKESKYQSELFICVGPYFGEFSERQERFDYFSELLGYKTIFSQYYLKGEWQNNWSCSAKILSNIRPNIEFETLSVSGKIKGFRSGSLTHFEKTGKFYIRAVVEDTNEYGEVKEDIVFLGWKEGARRPQIGDRVQKTRWKSLDDGREGIAYTALCLSEILDETPIERE